MLANQHPTIDLISNVGKNVLQKDIKKSTPDQVLLQGVTTSGTILSYHLHESLPSPPQPLFFLTIPPVKRSKQIHITSSTIFLNVGADDTKVFFAESSKDMEEVQFRKDEWESLVLPGRNMARVYEAFAKGNKGEIGKTGYRDFEYAVERHKLIEDMYKKWDEQQGMSGSG